MIYGTATENTLLVTTLLTDNWVRMISYSSNIIASSFYLWQILRRPFPIKLSRSLFVNKNKSVFKKYNSLIFKEFFLWTTMLSFWHRITLRSTRNGRSKRQRNATQQTWSDEAFVMVLLFAIILPFLLLVHFQVIWSLFTL